MKKKISFFIFSILVGLTAFSQQVVYSQEFEDEKEPMALKNEIHFNLLTSVLGLPEINYERFLESNFSVGLSVMAALDGPEKQELRSAFIPFGRLYFGYGNCEGFYIEGNAAVVSEKYRDYYYSSSSYSSSYGIQQSVTTTNSSTNFGLGVAVGYKFLTKNNWVGDIFAGAGRIFGDTSIDAYPRVGISIGKRF